MVATVATAVAGTQTTMAEGEDVVEPAVRAVQAARTAMASAMGRAFVAVITLAMAVAVTIATARVPREAAIAPALGGQVATGTIIRARTQVPPPRAAIRAAITLPSPPSRMVPEQGPLRGTTLTVLRLLSRHLVTQTARSQRLGLTVASGPLA